MKPELVSTQVLMVPHHGFNALPFSMPDEKSWTVVMGKEDTLNYEPGTLVTGNCIMDPFHLSNILLLRKTQL